MAREWLLRGVKPEELEPTQREEAPQTPQSRWENFWYHHKLKFWLILFAVVVVAVGVYQMVTRDDPDYRVLLITETSYTPTELETLATLLEAYGVDLDGDGKVEIQVENCQYGMNVNQYQNSGIQQVQAHLVAGDRMFFMWEPSTYKTFLKSLQNGDEEVDIFAPIEAKSTRIIERGKVYHWKTDPRPDESLKQRAPDLYFTVRLPQGTAESSKELHLQCKELLENFVADKKTAE